MALAISTVGFFVSIGMANSRRIADRFELFRIDRMISRGSLDEALKRLVLQIQEHPMQPRLKLRLAAIERKTGRITEAQETLQRAVELGLPAAEALREWSLLTSSIDFRAAEPGLIRGLDADRYDLETQRALSEGYLREGRWKDAVAACTGWLSADPNSEDAALGRVRGLKSLGRLDLALADCRAVLDRSPARSEVRLVLAGILIEAKRPEQAIAEVVRCRDRGSMPPEAFIILAAGFSAQGEPQAANSTLEQALVRFPNSAPVLRALAMSCRAQGREEQAGRLLDRADLLDPGRALP